MASSYLNTGRQVVDEYLDYNQKDHQQNDDDRNDDDRDNDVQLNSNRSNNQNLPNVLRTNLPPANQNRQNPNSYEQQNPNEFMRYNGNSGNSGQNQSNSYQQNGFHNQSQSQKSLSLEYGKSIKLMRNGDEFYRGQKYVINSRKYRYFDVFLDDISDSMNANFGAVRSIRTPVNGHRIRNLEEIEDGKTYVAAGSGRFIRLNYMDISEGKRNPPNRLPALTRPPPDYSNNAIPQYDKSQNVVIHVYRNGDIIHPPAKILLHKNTLASYDAVLNEITSKVHLTNGAVLKLYTLEGEQVVSPTQLISGNSYVGGNKERFKRCDYQATQNGSPRSTRKPVILKSHSNDDSNNAAATSRKLKPPLISQNSSNASAGKHFSYSGKPYTGWHKELPPVTNPKPHSTNGTYPGNVSSGIYNGNAPNNAPRRPEKKTNVDKDESGIYKARNNYNDNARTVDDDQNVYVDMPVDYKKPNQVIREEIKDRQEQGGFNQLSKPNSKPPPQTKKQDDFDEDDYEEKNDDVENGEQNPSAFESSIVNDEAIRQTNNSDIRNTPSANSFKNRSRRATRVLNIGDELEQEQDSQEKQEEKQNEENAGENEASKAEIFDYSRNADPNETIDDLDNSVVENQNEAKNEEEPINEVSRNVQEDQSNQVEAGEREDVLELKEEEKKSELDEVNDVDLSENLQNNEKTSDEVVTSAQVNDENDHEAQEDIQVNQEGHNLEKQASFVENNESIIRND